MRCRRGKVRGWSKAFMPGERIQRARPAVWDIHCAECGCLLGQADNMVSGFYLQAMDIGAPAGAGHDQPEFFLQARVFMATEFWPRTEPCPRCGDPVQIELPQTESEREATRQRRERLGLLRDRAALEETSRQIRQAREEMYRRLRPEVEAE